MSKGIVTACVGKRRYDTEQEALEATQYLRKTQDLSLSVYRCTVCGGWHLTKKRGRKKRCAKLRRNP